MKIAIVGAGPAGVTAAHLLADKKHEVTVFEKNPTAGGRTATVHFGPDHWLDTGAGWVTDFYPSTLGLLASSGVDHEKRPLTLRGGGELLLNGVRHPSPNSAFRILRSRIISLGSKARFFWWAARLFARQRGNLAVDRRFDSVRAIDALRGMGNDALENVVRPTFEGPFFARLEQMSATLVRSWLRSLSIGHFFRFIGGMDAPWRRLADTVPMRTSTPVLAAGGTAGEGAWLETTAGRHSFDAVVLAVPAPVAADLLGDGAPAELSAIGYVSHVRAYLARRTDSPALPVSLHVFPNDTVATVERGIGGGPAWGNVPEGWEWTLVCAPSSSSERLLELEDEELLARLFDTAGDILGEKIHWKEYEIVHLVRWEHAVPVVGVGYYQNIDRLHNSLPVVLAGDWLDQPCVEGAVRTGYRAARLLDASIPLPRSARISR